MSEGKEDPNTTESGPSSACQRFASGRWWPNNECWLGSSVIFQGIPTCIARKPYIFVIFQGGGGSGPLAPLWIRP